MYRLMIVDDEQIVRESLSALFDWREMGFEVAGLFEDGSDAAKYLETNEADAILADVRMYEMSGLELAKFAKERDPRVRIVMLSSYQEFEYVREAMRYGVCDYLLKPVGAEELKRAFAKVRAQLDAARNDGLAALTAAFGRDALRLEDAEFERRRETWMLAFVQANSAARRASVKTLFDAVYAEKEAEQLPPALEKRTVLSDFGLCAEECDVLTACDALGALREALARGERSRTQTLAERVSGYVDGHIAEDFTVEDVARRMFFSAGYLSREFKRATGENLSEYIIRRRMERAVELMRARKYTAPQLCALVGYNDAHYFLRAFKKYSGLTLREWYERHGEAQR